MPFFRLFLPLAAVFAVFLYLSPLNRDPVIFTWASDRADAVPLIVLLTLAFAAGAAVMAVVQLMRRAAGAIEKWDARWDEWKLRRIESAFAKAQRHAQEGKMPHALDALNMLLAKRPRHYGALLLKGDILSRMGRPAEALGPHSLALSLRPAARDPLLSIARDYCGRKEWDAAHRLLEQARERWPEDAAILAALRDVDLARGDFKRAVLDQKALASSVGEEGRIAEQVRLAELYLLYGEQLMGQGDDDEAGRQFAAAASLRPDCIAAYMLQAEALVRGGGRSEAETLLTRAFDRTHGLAPLLRLDSLIMVHGGAQKSLELLAWASAAAPEVPGIPLLALLREIDLGYYDAARYRLASLDERIAGLSIAVLIRGLLELRNFPAPDPQALAALEKGIATERAALAVFRCRACGAREREYFTQCAGCGAWDSVTVLLEDETA